MTLYQLVRRFDGEKEIPGQEHNPLIVAFHYMGGSPWFEDDETPWCSSVMCASAGYILGLCTPERAKARAREWLNVGVHIDLDDCVRGNDIIILSRGINAPGPEVIVAPGHVGVYHDHNEDWIWMWGGNQNNEFNLSKYPRNRYLGARRLYQVEEV